MKTKAAEVEVGALSETGYRREENQDRMSGSTVPLGRLYIVADGMGGHKAGGLAAQLTVQGLHDRIFEAEPNAPVEDVLKSAFERVNADVHAKAHAQAPDTKGMGSTALVLLMSENVVRLAHVGDSRAYLYRNGRLKPLTKDHTMVQRMVDAGILTSQQAVDHPDSSVLSRAIGAKESVEVDISDDIEVQEGDGFLMCSDGLSGYASDAEIEQILQSNASVQKLTRKLVDLALSKGGKDNITVQYIQYGSRKETVPHKTWLTGKSILSVIILLSTTVVVAAAAAGYVGFLYADSADKQKGLEKKIERLNQEQDDLLSKISLLKTEIAEKDNASKRINEKIVKKNSKIIAIAEEKRILQKRLAKIGIEKSEYIAKIASIEKKNNEIKKTVGRLKNDIDILQKTIDQQAAEINAQKGRQNSFKITIIGEGTEKIPIIETAKKFGMIEIDWQYRDKLPDSIAAMIGRVNETILYYADDADLDKVRFLNEKLKLDIADFQKMTIDVTAAFGNSRKNSYIILGRNLNQNELEESDSKAPVKPGDQSSKSTEDEKQKDVKQGSNGN